MHFLLKELSDIDVEDLIKNNFVAIGLDIGDKTIGISVSDRRLKIASPLITFFRKRDCDFQIMLDTIKNYNVGLIIFGWPIQMDGTIGDRCKKNLDFVNELSRHIDAPFSKWDERFSTKAVTNIMLMANISREKRKKVIDKTAAVYILQGAIDYLNRRRDTKIQYEEIT
jgi:putative Holliday junction resolvase